MTDTRWLTYDELAKALRITPDSARRLVARRKWSRKPGNDGKARIGVPIERLTPDSPPDVGTDVLPVITADSLPDTPPDTTDVVTPVLRIMAQHIERLERELEAVKVERDDERARAADLALKAGQVEALNVILETERKHADTLRQDRDRWAVQAHALAHPPIQPRPERRGMFDWIRKRA